MNDAIPMHDSRTTLALVSSLERSFGPVRDTVWRGSDNDTQTLPIPRRTQGKDTRHNQALLNALQVAVSDLFQAVRAAIDNDPSAATQCWHRAVAALGDKPAFALRPDEAGSVYLHSSRFIKGGLTAWQINRVNKHIDNHIDAAIHVKDLAALARLTQSHFCRTFKESCGDSPHRYLMRRRVEHAQRLMLTTTTPLCQIAAACGLADQPHFNRIFRKFVGETPGSWRRARAVPAE
jgi:AraC family transcriptional regulator